MMMMMVVVLMVSDSGPTVQWIVCRYLNPSQTHPGRTISQGNQTAMARQREMARAYSLPPGQWIAPCTVGGGKHPIRLRPGLPA